MLKPKKPDAIKKNNSKAEEKPKQASAQQPTVSNTLAFAYFDKKNLPKECVKDKGDIERECQPESDEKRQKRVEAKPGLLGKLKIKSKKMSSGPGASPSSWMDDHCDFLMIKPSPTSPLLAEIYDIPHKMIEKLAQSGQEKMLAKLEQELEEAALKKIGKMGLKQGLVRIGSFAGGPLVGGGVNILMTVDGANDLKNATKEFPKLLNDIDKAKSEISKAREEIIKAKDQIEQYREKTGSTKGELKTQALVTDIMHEAVKTSPCITARRCGLVPYGETNFPNSANGLGCCPGQSGHHILPNAMFAGCVGYNPDEALTICVEGVTNSHGSHKVVHENLKSILAGTQKADGTPLLAGDPMPLQDAIDAGTESIKQSFPLSECDTLCIQKQLEASYKKYAHCLPKSHSGAAGSGAKKAKAPAKRKSAPKITSSKPKKKP
ncbi:hypothetical protein F2P45_31070 [Massilia sp. CCM 8733]|uniref:Tox-GHH2 domain-containing protein n=1 Tax=Massilia mucilaginosa TaxID=2609282 RepID=A0ABX0P4Q7_9BURK|nr:HNH/endonuclease VII fold toxin-2 domain-containing protein [Massilia mucilaginosa]NHZ93417.1 hypothetical protein [Massilia mucilaginosa]